jgi:AAA domain
MIIIDTLAKGMAAGGGDENAAKDMGAALAHLALVKERTGVHVAIVHHTGKDESKGARGSNSLLGDVDLQIQLSGDGDIRTATIVHANDQAEGVLTRFKGETVVLGQDEDGDDITTMILSLDDCGGTGDGKQSKVRLGPTERRAKDLLHNALNDHAKDAPHADGFPFGVKVVTVDMWKDYCRRGGLSDGDTGDAFRKAFKRAMTSLVNAHRIGILDGHVWVAYD